MGWRAPRSQELEDARLADVAEDAANLLAAKVAKAQAVVDLAEGGGGADLDAIKYVQSDEPATPDPGDLWLMLPLDPLFDVWDNVAYQAGAVVPTVANDHWYTTPDYGDAGVTEPTWPTDGSTVVDGDLTWTDQGLIADAVADGTLYGDINWQLWRRNDANNGWDTVGIGDQYLNFGAIPVEHSQYKVFDASGVLRGRLRFAFGNLDWVMYGPNGEQRATIDLDAERLSLNFYDGAGFGVSHMELNADGIALTVPSVDPEIADHLWNNSGVVTVSAG